MDDRIARAAEDLGAENTGRGVWVYIEGGVRWQITERALGAFADLCKVFGSREKAYPHWTRLFKAKQID